MIVLFVYLVVVLAILLATLAAARRKPYQERIALLAFGMTLGLLWPIALGAVICSSVRSFRVRAGNKPVAL